MADREKIRELRKLCEDMELENRGILERYTDEELAAIYNGIGPESFPAWLRKCVDRFHPTLEPVAFIHDVEWHESDGEKRTFDESNARFRRNGVKAACWSFGWWRPRRYKVMWDAVKFARLCSRFGWSSFTAPYESRTGGGE